MMFDAAVNVRAQNNNDIKAAAPESPLGSTGLNHPPLWVSRRMWFGRELEIIFLQLHPGALKAVEKLADKGRVTSDQHSDKLRVLIPYLTDMRKKSCKM